MRHHRARAFVTRFAVKASQRCVRPTSAHLSNRIGHSDLVRLPKSSRNFGAVTFHDVIARASVVACSATLRDCSSRGAEARATSDVPVALSTSAARKQLRSKEPRSLRACGLVKDRTLPDRNDFVRFAPPLRATTFTRACSTCNTRAGEACGLSDGRCNAIRDQVAPKCFVDLAHENSSAPLS